MIGGVAAPRWATPTSRPTSSRWYAPYQFANGKVPCCVDARGADPVPENDSARRADLPRRGDVPLHARPALLRSDVAARRGGGALSGSSCAQRSARDANLRPATARSTGCCRRRSVTRAIRPSPCTRTGTTSGRSRATRRRSPIAAALGRRRRAHAGWRRSATSSATISPRRCGRAIAPTASTIFPASAELGDFDPTSTTIAIAPGGELHALATRRCVLGTFERYWREFVDRRDGRGDWEDYTPYELRNVGTFMRLGWRDRAHELLGLLHGRPSSAGVEPMARGRRPGSTRSRASSATCRTAGSPRTSSAPRWISSPTSATATTRSCSPPAFPPNGWRRPGIAVKGLRHAVRTAELFSSDRDGGNLVLISRWRAGAARAASCSSGRAAGPRRRPRA